jgi:predicted TPR repeat methyltransferase
VDLENRIRIYDNYFESGYKYTNILTKKGYENAYIEYDSLYGKILPNDRNAAILDVGCGTGYFLYYLKKRAYKNYLGIDVSAQQVEFCKKNISVNVELADAISFLKGKKGEYSVVVAHDVLEHIPKQDVFTFLELIYGALNKNGIFIIRVPNMSNPFSLDSRYRDFTHETGFTEKSLYQILSNVGFRGIDISSTNIRKDSFQKRIRRVLVDLMHKCIRFLYYIQDFSVPENLGKNLIVICEK